VDTEFHYWITGLIAQRAGFSKPEARVIAHACELVDRNDVSLTVEDRHGGPPFVNSISQTLNILKPRHELMRIYPIFHFVPGDPSAPGAWRRDGRLHLLNTTPGGPVAQELLEEALRAPGPTRPYRIGIASHAFEDSFAHQNFVGWHDPFNHLGLDPKPNIGHADAEHHPDWISHVWHDDRLLEPRISNRERFLGAAHGLFRELTAAAPDPPPEGSGRAWESLESELVRLMGLPWSGPELRGRELRVRRYRDLMPWLEPFDERTWFDAAVRTEVRGLRDSHQDWRRALTVFEDRYAWRDGVDPESTHWMRFQQAVIDHEHRAIELLSPTFAKMGVELARA
jgi:hypothetical protein